ncbi:hypothetical protein C8R43DRAFT_963453 [Mycena crocata]|nr:hypothetical protein C8R43DRAFT_963453 [Mycena crocata]
MTLAKKANSVQQATGGEGVEPVVKKKPPRKKKDQGGDNSTVAKGKEAMGTAARADGAELLHRLGHNVEMHDAAPPAGRPKPRLLHPVASGSSTVVQGAGVAQDQAALPPPTSPAPLSPPPPPPTPLPVSPSSHGNKTVPVCPDAAGSWFRTVYLEITAMNLGGEFNVLLSVFIELEGAFNWDVGPKGGKGLGSGGTHPDELNKWVTATQAGWRRPMSNGNGLQITSVTQFEASWWHWWADLQPA